MSADVTFIGLDEFYKELAALPETWKAAATEAARGTADLMAREVRQAYAAQFKMHTGNLVNDIRVEQIGPLTFIVVNRAPEAHLLEFGTAMRTLHSSGASRGRITAHPVFIPLALKYRRQLLERLKVICEASGAQVFGLESAPTLVMTAA
jgi:hypothetical protein